MFIRTVFVGLVRRFIELGFFLFVCQGSRHHQYEAVTKDWKRVEFC